jgi:hypothetical protein
MSSKRSQAFFSRFSRSTRCALVSVISLMFPPQKCPPQKQKAHVGLTSGNVGFGTYACLRLSPENPLARDGRLATRSVARARTTDHLAANTHRVLRIRLTRYESQIALNAKTKFIVTEKQMPVIAASWRASLF